MKKKLTPQYDPKNTETVHDVNVALRTLKDIVSEDLLREVLFKEDNNFVSDVIKTAQKYEDEVIDFCYDDHKED